MKVFVYYNLHRKLWSIKALEGDNKGKVIAHRHDVVLHKPKAKVSEAGRQRVLREQRKNVHAGLVGEWMDQKILQAEGDLITYNPYKYTTFVYADDKQPFTGASLALMQDREVYVL
jgi:hypothetical protein